MEKKTSRKKKWSKSHDITQCCKNATLQTHLPEPYGPSRNIPCSLGMAPLYPNWSSCQQLFFINFLLTGIHELVIMNRTVENMNILEIIEIADHDSECVFDIAPEIDEVERVMETLEDIEDFDFF